jgi:hypothetical protein
MLNCLKRAETSVVLIFFTVSSVKSAQCLLSTVTDQDRIVLVPDSCWAMIINGNSTRADFTEDNLTFF